MTTVQLTAGEYESAENILHLWFPRRVELTDEQTIRSFFDEVLVDWIQPCSSDDERSAREAIRKEKEKHGVVVHASNVRHHPAGRRQ